MAMAAPKPREIAECCLDLLSLEVVHLYSGLEGRQNSGTVEAIGFHVGQQLAERFTKDRPRFAEVLEVLKYICKDFWTEIFKKPVDNLRTNHRGVYVLQDNEFRWLSKLSSNGATAGAAVGEGGAQGGGGQAAEAAEYLMYPCGLIRGALFSLGVPCTVSAEVSSPPACSFTVRVKT